MKFAVEVAAVNDFQVSDDNADFHLVPVGDTLWQLHCSNVNWGH